MTDKPRESGRRRVVIVGGGFAGAYCARELEKRLGADEVEITLLDRRNYLVFHPLLLEAGTGELEPRHVVVAIRSFLKRSHLIVGDMRQIDFQNKRVHYDVLEGKEHRELNYDHLVLAMGSVTNMPPVPGLKEYSYEIKGLADAVALRDRAVQVLESASLMDDPARRKAALHLVVVGGSYTGVETAGLFHEYMREAAEKYPRLDPAEVQTTLVERGPAILKTVDEKLSAYASRRLRKRGVQVLCNETISAIEPGAVVLGSGRRLESNTCVWAAGIMPPPEVIGMPLPADRLGYLESDPELRIKGQENVWGIGDCTVNPSPEGTPYPATAQHAIREGICCARNIASVIHGQEPQPLKYQTRGYFACFSRHDAVAKVFGLRLSGFIAWWFYRSFYLMQMPGWGRRFRLAVDWTLSLLFSQDFVELGVHRAVRMARRMDNAPAGALPAANAQASAPDPISMTGSMAGTPKIDRTGTPRAEDAVAN